MTKNISEEELLLRKRARRRLVGAIVLVVFCVIVLPIIFDEPKSENEQQEIAINLATPNKTNIVALPPKEESTRRETFNKIDALPDLQDESKTHLQNIEETTELLDERKRTPIPGIKPKIDSKNSIETKNVVDIAINTPNTANTANNAAVTTEVSKGFVIQLGAFSDQLKARQQVENLIFNGFKAYTETLKTGNSEVTRVRIGSFTTRNIAESELKKLKKLGFDGVITSR
jgi:DedD protein